MSTLFARKLQPLAALWCWYNHLSFSVAKKLKTIDYYSIYFLILYSFQFILEQ